MRIIIITILLVTMTSFSNVSLGGNLGLNSSTLTGDYGYVFSPCLSFLLDIQKASHFSIITGLSFSGKGWTYSSTFYNNTYRSNYMTIPVHAHIILNSQSHKNRFFIEPGGNLNLLQKIISEYELNERDYNSIDIGATLCTGLDNFLAKNFTLGVSGEFGIFPIRKTGHDINNYKNISYQIFIRYWLNKMEQKNN